MTSLCQNQPRFIEREVTHSSEKLIMQREIVITETRNEGESTFKLGSSINSSSLLRIKKNN